MEEMFEDIPIQNYSISLQSAGESKSVAFSQLVALAEKRGIPLSTLRGSAAGNPICMEFFGYPTRHPIDLCLKLNVDMIEYCVQHNM